MLRLLQPLTNFLKIKQIDIYNNVFKLHTKLTVALLLAFSMLVSAHEYFGTPMDCIHTDTTYKKFFDNVCWITGTFTIKNLPGVIGKHMVSHGVNGNTSKLYERSYQRYYQWIVVILLIQAILFYIPAFLWKIWEHGRIKQLCTNLDSSLLPNDYIISKKALIKYLLLDNSDAHTFYAVRFFTCEAINLLIVVFNMCLMHIIFDGFWWEYAPAVGALLRNDWARWSFLSDRVFPKLAKCEFRDFGPSGSVQMKDSLCLLSLNILNEKIFAFLWIWIIFVAIISSINVVYRIVVLICVSFRIQLLRTLALPLTYSQIKKASNNGNIGDWFVLYQLGRNVNPYAFREVIEELADLKRNRSSVKFDLYA